MNEEKQFFICFVEGSDGGKGYQHPSFDAAKLEAERLASLPGNSGKKVYIFAAVGYVIERKTDYICLQQDLPF